MKFKVLLFFCISLLVLSCSKSDDSSDENELPQATSSLIIDQGTSTEVLFNSTLPRGNFGCGELSMSYDMLISNELVVSDFYFGYHEYWDREMINMEPLYFLLRVKINDEQFVEASDNILTITKFEEISIDGYPHFIISGSANVIISPNNSDSDQENRTINLNFENILSTNLGAAC